MSRKYEYPRSNDNAAAPDAEQQTAEVLPLECAYPQEHRHHQVIAHHGGKGNGRNNYHTRGSREAAQEHEKGEEFLVVRKWEREDKGIRVDSPFRKPLQPRQRDGQHEQIDGEQIQGKQPCRFLEMFFVHILHDEHLELPGQKHDGHHGEKGQGQPRGVSSTQGFEPHELLQLREFHGTPEEVPRSGEYTVRDEYTHRAEGEQFDHRLEGDGRHHALVPLCRINVAGAEEDGKGRHDECHVQSRVMPHGRPARGRDGRHVRIHVQNGEARGHGFELQRYVRHDSHNSDNGHQSAYERTLPIAGSDEIGNGGNAMRLRDAYDLAQHKPPEGRHQGGPEVDGQKAHTPCRSASHASVEGPRGAVDGDGERIDVRVTDNRAAHIGTPVAEVGYGEQHTKVAEGDEQNDPLLQHLSPSPSLWEVCASRRYFPAVP
jgi:hypothetical protein